MNVGIIGFEPIKFTYQTKALPLSYIPKIVVYNLKKQKK